jgi:heme/copper-type cytochrome/quinol oxidase subunit 4
VSVDSIANKYKSRCGAEGESEQDVPQGRERVILLLIILAVVYIQTAYPDSWTISVRAIAAVFSGVVQMLITLMFTFV